jgi:hypothetical protein
VSEPLQFLNFDFDADPNVASHFDEDPASENDADPDRGPQH